MTAPVHTKTPAAISEYRAAAGAGEARSPQAEGVAPLNLDHHVPIWPVATEHLPTTRPGETSLGVSTTAAFQQSSTATSTTLRHQSPACQNELCAKVGDA